MKEKIDAAIAAHSQWKSRLKTAIETGKSEFDPAIVKQDNQCEFGKWIYGLTGAETQDPHFQTVKEDHAKFHAAAGKVLELALSGKKEEAEKEMSLNSEFSSCSSRCILALSDWKKKVA